ncbi:MAG: hypothetical protein ACYC7E_13620 [Armatimonadota bacterium]
MRSSVACLIALWLYAGMSLTSPANTQPLITFAVTERFGVAHPDQIIDFDLAAPVDAKNAYLLGPDGAEVPYQLLENGKKLAVRTDLPVGAEKTWKLMTGHAPAPARDGVQVTEGTTCYEITNGLTGIRVIKPVPVTGAAWKPLFDLLGWDGQAPRVYLPAPVQGVRYRDGQWSAVGPNGLAALATAFTGMTVTFRERGPLKVVVEVAYSFARPAIDNKGNGDLPAGPARYISIIEVQAGQPSILFEEDAETDVTWSMDCYAGLQPTTGRYRGHHASTPEYGHGPDGAVWGTNLGPSNNAETVLRYDRPMRSDFRRGAEVWGRMAVWDPWVFDSGWWWQVYDDKAPATGNVLGIFAGRASRALGATFSGTGIFTLPPASAGGSPRAGLTIALYGRCPSTRALIPHSRYQWGLFLGVKGADLAPQTAVQPINRQMNLHASINLNKLHRLQLDFPDPPGGYGSIYMDPPVLRRLLNRLRNDKDFLARQRAVSNGAQQEYLLFWADAGGQQAHTRLKSLDADTTARLQTLIHGNGTYDKSTNYYEGCWGTLNVVSWADQLLASGTLSPVEAARVKALAVVNAAILLDDDHTPRGAAHGLNMGNANMPTIHTSQRQTAALLLAGHPMAKALLPTVWPTALGELHNDFNADGAHVSAVGYIDTTQTLLMTLLAAQHLGLGDAFVSETRLAKFAHFYLNVMTPPECRFGGLRKMLPIGDSSTSSSVIPALLATGFAKSQPALSAQLMGAWRAMGGPLSALSPAAQAINQELPGAPPMLGDAAYPGYYSVLRYGCNTPEETAAWCVNGNTYGDHAHNDLGTVVYYALGAPLSLDWSGRYPSTKAGIYHSTVIEEKYFGHPWDSEAWVDPYDPRETGGAGLSGHSGYVAPASATQEGLLSFTAASRMASRIEHRGLVWRRTITQMHLDPAHPLLFMQDRFSGQAPDQPKIFTMNFLADGPLQTPAGAMTPPLRDYSNPLGQGEQKKESPSAGPVFAVKPGVNRLSFTGQRWPKHPTQGIDWEVFLIPEEEQQAQIGNWAIFWQPLNEQGQFKAATGRPLYEERQHILRVRGTGGFTTLILPYRKGEQPADLAVTREGETLRIAAHGETTLIDTNRVAVYAKTRQMLASFVAQEVTGAGLRIAGGSAEVVLTDKQATITLHGVKGERRITLPKSVHFPHGRPLSRSIRLKDGQLIVDYAGGAPVTIILARR